MSLISYANKYGELEFEVGTYQPVADIRSHNIDPSLFFSVDVAEQIALITGNHRIQLCVTYDRQHMFLIHHRAASVAAVCRVTRLQFKPEFNAQSEIEMAARRNRVGVI